MGNGLRFPYLLHTELWGRGIQTRAGKGKTGTNGGHGVMANPHAELNAMTWSELIVAKRASILPRKAAIVMQEPVP